MIPCVDHITGEVSEKRVVSTTVNKVDRLTELNIDGEIIRCTETHPFQVKGKGWVDAANLVPGDCVYTKDWNTATVQCVNLITLSEPVDVFNFEVEDCHTYFVDDLCMLVHNQCKGNWSKGSFNSPQESATHHFFEHGPQVGAKSIQQYTTKATSFANDVLAKRVKRKLVPGYTENVYRYRNADKYVDLVYDGVEHLIVSFGRTR